MRRPTRRDLPLVLVLVVAAGVLAYLLLRQAEPDDPFARYCEEVEEHQAVIGAARSAGETTGLIRALPAFEDLAEAAPDDIEDEWRIVVSRVTDLRDALADADVDPAAYDPEKPPEGVDAEDLEAIKAAAVRLGSRETAAALTGVEQQARDVCQTPLSL